MNDRYGWDDRYERDSYRREGSPRDRDYDDSYRGPGPGSSRGWRSEDQDWRSRSEFDRERSRGQADYDMGQRGRGGSTFGYGDGRVGGYGGSSGGYERDQGDYRGGAESYARQDRYGGQDQVRQPYTSSGYGYGPTQAGTTPPQPYFTGQQQSWEVPSSRGAPGSFGSSYGGGSGGYGGGAGGYGDDYREHGYGHREHQRGFLQRAGDEVASWFGDDDAARRREHDHRGRGPQDYTRSDERIREDVNDRLTDDWRVDASNISVMVESGEVTLNGTVSRRGDKRRAEDIVEDISGVQHVQNNLRVQQTDVRSDESGTTTTTGVGRAGSSTAVGSGNTSATGMSSSTPTSETRSTGRTKATTT